MAIKIKSDCNICVHKKVCRYKDNAKHDAEKLKKMTYGPGPNNDYDWDTMTTNRNVNITFECPSYVDEQKQQVLSRR